MTQPIIFQRIEGSLALAASLWFYHVGNGNWWLFAILLFSIDLFMVGYLINSRVGAITYNLGHSYAIAGLIALIYLVASGQIPTLLFIWFAHIGLDRLLGFGLKLPNGFRHTHLGLIGRR